MEFRAEARYMRVSPQKARLVLELIKGQRVEDARNTLLFTKKRVASTVGKLLQSAIDNANFLSTEKNLDVDLDQLYVKNAVANDGPRMKRIRPAPMGRAFRYVRRISHLEIVLAERNRNGQSVATVVGEDEKKVAAKAPANEGQQEGRKEKSRRQEDGSEEISFGSPTPIAGGRYIIGATMGQKVHPYGFRLGYTKPWKSRWFVERDYDKLLLEDVKLKAELKDKLKSAGISCGRDRASRQ